MMTTMIDAAPEAGSLSVYTDCQSVVRSALDEKYSLQAHHLAAGLWLVAREHRYKIGEVLKVKAHQKLGDIVDPVELRKATNN